MSRLILVRHAQASFHADHYDQLSPLGERQSRVLAAAWIRQQQSFDEVYVGPRARQRQTAEIVVASYLQADLPFPQPVSLPELDEYDLGGILHRLAPAFARQDAEFARVLESQRSGATDRERERSFQTMFEPLLRHWQSAESAAADVESWPAFSSRVARGLKHITQQPGQGRRVAAFTSGGFIGAALQQVLAAPAAAALAINWRIRNASLTDLVFSGERLTLDSFNSIAHFEEPELVTFR